MKQFVVRTNDIVSTLNDVELGRVSPDEAFDRLVMILSDNLRNFGASANLKNVATVVDILCAHISPFGLREKAMLEKLSNGWSPKFTTTSPESHALERGVAVLVSHILTYSSPDTANRAAGVVFDVAERRGHLPRPEDVQEY